MTQTLDTIETSWEWDSHEADANGPTWLAIEPCDLGPEDEHSINAEGGCDDDSHDTMHMIAPANDLPGDVYGWYTDSANPSFVFARSEVPAILAMPLADAHAMLLARVSATARQTGMPWYV
jgi:hypothetical protein